MAAAALCVPYNATAEIAFLPISGRNRRPDTARIWYYLVTCIFVNVVYSQRRSFSRISVTETPFAMAQNPTSLNR
jgi:hypothetical protein